MSTQYAVDIPISASHQQQAFKLIELPQELLALLESEHPPAQVNLVTNASATGPGYALLKSDSKTYQMRQKNTSNPIILLKPALTKATPADEAATFIPQPSVSAIAKIEDTIELIPHVENVEKAPPRVNKWHEKFAKSRTTKKDG